MIKLRILGPDKLNFTEVLKTVLRVSFILQISLWYKKTLLKVLTHLLNQPSIFELWLGWSLKSQVLCQRKLRNKLQVFIYRLLLSYAVETVWNERLMLKIMKWVDIFLCLHVNFVYKSHVLNTTRVKSLLLKRGTKSNEK